LAARVRSTLTAVSPQVLNTREKQLKQYIADYMKDVKIDSVNLKKGKVRVKRRRPNQLVTKRFSSQVTVKTSERAGTMTKAAVQNGLTIYFQGDEIMVEAAMNCILDNIDKKQMTTVSLTGLKEK
jgi:hypothetical protein